MANKCKEIGEAIASYLMSRYEKNEKISDDILEKESYEAVADCKGDIKDYAIAELIKNGYKVER